MFLFFSGFCSDFHMNKNIDVFLTRLLLSIEQSLERQVLQSQCRRLETQNYNLSLAAEQLSHTMGVRCTNRHKRGSKGEK